MQNYPLAHFSNRTEKLYESLKVTLFTHSHPFTKRIIIVPSAAMKAWLTLKMATDPDMNVAAGVEIGFIETTLNRLHHSLSFKTIPDKETYEPSELELTLALERCLEQVITTFHSLKEPQQKILLPLVKYLGGVNETHQKISKNCFKRIRGLAPVLAKLFLDYGVYGQEMLLEWQSTQTDWQHWLWNEMEEMFVNWNYPARKLKAFQIDASFDPYDIQIHLFGASFLAPLYHRFLNQIAAHLPVHYYLLSPCQKFWGDILSDKESSRLKIYWEKQGINHSNFEALDAFLRDRNPLLANFGRLGREMTLSAEMMETIEAYAIPQSVLIFPAYQELYYEEIDLEKTETPLTLLEAIQTDMVLLRSLESQNKMTFNTYDETIQIHAASKKMREVEVVYDVLLSIIDKHANDPFPILPSDIFVMAPNISDYTPFIRSVFESSASQLSIQLTDLKLPSQALLVQAFLHLLSLSCGRWEASAFLQLFDYACFRDRHHLSEEDVHVIKRWIKESGICWGKDLTHRHEFFKNTYEEEIKEDFSQGTWENGLGRLLEGLVMVSDTSDLSNESVYHPVNRIDASKAELLGLVIQLIRSLQADLKPLMDETKQTLENWSIYLKCLLKGYFFHSEEEEEKEGYRLLVECLDSFKKSSTRLKEHSFSFETIYRHLKNQLEKEIACYKDSHLESVRFSSLLPMRAVPAKVIVLMGMGDGLFPRVDQMNSLNKLLEHFKGEYYPNKVDFDRYIFLESLLSARRYFILTYVCQQPGESKSIPPSLLVKELMTYLDHSYVICPDVINKKPSEWCFYAHKINNFHYSYFSANERFQSYSHVNYLASKAHYEREKKERSSFLSEFIPQELKENKETLITIRDLLAHSKNPLKIYLNHVLGIYLDKKEEHSVKDEEELLLSDLNAAILIKKGVFGCKTSVIKSAEKSGQLPSGPFKPLGREKIERTIDQFHENLKSYEVNIEELFSVELNHHTKNPYFSEKVWQLPAIELDVPSVGKVKIIGGISDVCAKGLVLFYEETIKKIFEVWPSCLILRYLIEKYSLEIVQQMIFIKGKKIKIREFHQKEHSFSSEELLICYLQYYFGAKNSPSPLVPDLIPTIFSGNQTKEFTNLLHQDLDQEYKPQYDAYLTWLGKNSSKAEITTAANHWHATAQTLFVDVYRDKKAKKPSDQFSGEC